MNKKKTNFAGCTHLRHRFIDRWQLKQDQVELNILSELDYFQPEFKIEGAPWGSEKSLERKVARLSTIALRQAPRLDRKKIIDI